MSIPGLDEWLQTAQAKHVLDWEQASVDNSVTDIFGFNALQFGLTQCDFLRANRIALRQQVVEAGTGDIQCEFTALPFATQSIDLIVLPHILEFHAEPHQILREVERVLMPEGQLLILGFNPVSLWGAHQRMHRGEAFPFNGNYLSVLRLKDWLKLLGFDVDRATFGCYAPPLDQEKWIRRWNFMENTGPKWWGFAGGVYLLRAIKRVHSMRLITPKWNSQGVQAKALRPIARKEGHGR